jgi:hypothetical protein
MEPSLAREFILAAPIVNVAVNPKSPSARFYREGQTILDFACQSDYKGSAKVVIAQVPCTSRYYICIGDDGDAHTDILHRGLSKVLGPNWRNEVINSAGGEFRVTIDPTKVRVFGGSITLDCAIEAKLGE